MGKLHDGPGRASLAEKCQQDSRPEAWGNLERIGPDKWAQLFSTWSAQFKYWPIMGRNEDRNLKFRVVATCSLTLLQLPPRIIMLMHKFMWCKPN